MLSIYYGREDIDKSRFIYENVEKDTIMIVPDQFTLEAEKDALTLMKREGIMDVEVLSFSRLASRLLEENGGAKLPAIDKQGRHMLLARIMAKIEPELGIYGKYKSSTTFITMLNNMISELKQYDVSPQRLKEIAEEADSGVLLERKLGEIAEIYDAYEENISDKYKDTEDIADLFVQTIGKSALVCGHNFWIYGFDVFSPKNLKAIGELIGAAKSVNIVLTCDEGSADAELFAVCRETMTRLQKLGEEKKQKANIVKIPQEYKRQMPGAIVHIERNLYALPFERAKDDAAITMKRAGNIYNEAETAAVFAKSLVRDRGYRYRDIVVIMNDISGAGRIVKRAFDRHGVPMFLDEKRRITHLPPAAFMRALADIIAGSYKTEDVMRLVKTGLLDVTHEEIEDLDNYATSFGIKGRQWKEPFTKQGGIYSEGEVAEAETTRKKVIDAIMSFHDAYKKEKTVKGKVLTLYEFMTEIQVPEKIERLCSKLSEEDENEAAEEMTQVWGTLMGVLEQMTRLIGDDTISATDFALMLGAGIESISIGVLPPTTDVVLAGTMQRTRISNAKVVMVLGANEGVLPMAIADSGILADEEKQRLTESLGIEISKMDSLRQAEESLAIYRNLVKPTENLYISYALADADGARAKASMIFDRLVEMFPERQVTGDIFEDGNEVLQIDSVDSTMPELGSMLQTVNDPSAIWVDAFSWIEQNEPEKAALLRRGLEFDGAANQSVSATLFDSGTVKVSASRLENYSGCPFAYFLRYNLDANEHPIYELDVRETGTIYHECMMRIARRLTMPDVKVTSDESPWMKISTEALREMTKETIEGIADDFKDGIMNGGGSKHYVESRMQSVCFESAQAMVEHVRCGNIDEMLCEIKFGSGQRLRPLVIETQGGSVVVEGKIDRLDIMPGDEAKVIDYKSSSRDVTIDEVTGGWELQLAIYLKVAQENGLRPVGTFYYHLHEPEIKLNDCGGDIEAELRRSFRMNGFFQNEEKTIENIDHTLVYEDDRKSSRVLPVSLKKDGGYSARSGKAMNEAELAELLDEVTMRISELATDMSNGNISIKPKRSKKRDACDYCPYSSICKFDTRFEECRYDFV